jgi:hypothetical protein
MAKFQISYGVGGGYNDISTEVIESDSLNSAQQYAYDAAVQVFDSYGIYENENELEDGEWNDEEYQDCLESWIDYSAVEIVD